MSSRRQSSLTASPAVVLWLLAVAMIVIPQGNRLIEEANRGGNRLIVHTQQRLSAHRGLLQVRGLHPRLLPDTAAAAPAAAPGAGSIRGSRPVSEPAS